MTETEDSLTNTQPLMMTKKRNQLSSNNLFNNHQRNHSMTSKPILPIISVSSFSNLKEKFIRMASNNNNNHNKSTIRSNSPNDFRITTMKSRISYSNRQNSSKLNVPTTNSRPTTQQQNNRLLYVVNTPSSSQRTISAQLSNKNLKPSSASVPSQQQQQTNFTRPYSQYGHFLAYLRRQSYARLRRKQDQEAGNTDNIETTITLNLNKHSSTQSFHSSSNHSLASITVDTTPIRPTISITAKRAGRPISSYNQLQRSLTTYRLSAYQQPPQTTSKHFTEDQLLSLSSSSLLITPRNSVVDDEIMSPMVRTPYDLYLNNYINDHSRVKYHGHMLSTAV